MSPRPDVSEQRREQILDAALAAFTRLGIDQARMDDIVHEAGLSKGALYWYFDSKDTLVMALTRRLFDGALDGLRLLHGLPGTVDERLTRFVHAASDEFSRLHQSMPIVFELYAEATRRDDVRRFLRGYFRDYQEALAALVQQGVDRGEFRPVHPQQTAIMLTALFEGLTMLWGLHPDEARWEEQVAAALRLLLDGLQASP